MPIYKVSGQKKFKVRVNYVASKGNYKAKYATADSYLEATQKYEELYKNRFFENKLTLGALCDDYKRSISPRVKVSTYETIEILLNKILREFGENIYIHDITPTLVRNWNTRLLNSKYSRSYIHDLSARFATLMNYAEQYYGLTQNPVKLAGMIYKGVCPEKKIFTIDEFIQFMNHIDKEKELTYWVIFQVMFFTGCRIGEILALYPSDIDFDNHLISINKTYCVSHGHRYLNTPKTAKSSRQIRIPTFLSDILSEYVKRLPVSDLRIFFNVSSHGLKSKQDVICKRAGLKKIRIHDFRHSAASYLISQNIPLLEVSKRLGHTSPVITYKVYGHLYPDKDKKIAALEEKDFENWDL